MNEELLYNQLYDKTKDCGRTQFVRLLMEKERENKNLKDEIYKSNAVADTNKELAESYYKDNQQLKEQNERLLELCMYALISSTKIYNHELANDTKKSFINIIKNNLNYDTYILKNKLLEAWRSDK